LNEHLRSFLTIKKHSKPYFMTPARKAHLAKWRALRKSNTNKITIHDMDSELDRLGRTISYEPKS